MSRPGRIGHLPVSQRSQFQVSYEVNRPLRTGGPVVPAFAACSRCLRRTAWSSPRDRSRMAPGRPRRYAF